MPSTYEKIASTTLGSSQSGITLSSIPATYTDLVLVFQYAQTSNSDNAFIRFNSDTGNNYRRVYGVGSPAGATTANNSSSDRIYFNPQVGSGTSLNTPGFLTINILSYANTTTYKNILARDNATKNDGGQQTAMYAGTWDNTAAITSITVNTTATNLLSGTSVTIYGIKAA